MTFSQHPLLELPSGRGGIEETPTGELKRPALSISAPPAKHLRTGKHSYFPCNNFPASSNSQHLWGKKKYHVEIPCSTTKSQKLHSNKNKIQKGSRVGNKNQGPKSKLSALKRLLSHSSCKVFIPPCVPK